MKQYLKTVLLLLVCCALMLCVGCKQEDPVLDTTTAPVTEPDIGDIPNIPLEEKTIDGEFYSKEAQVLIAAADAYVQRGEWIQYDDTYTDVTKMLRRAPYGDNQEPERANEQNTLYTNCSAWVYDLFYEAFDYDIRAVFCMNYFSERTDIMVYSGSHEQSRTDEQWKQICDEIYKILVPGDLIVVMHRDSKTGGESTIGHIILYVGGGKYAHSTGSNYNYEESREVYEEKGSVQYAMLADTYFNPTHSRYLKNETRWAIFRPLQKIESIPQKSLTRFASMQGIVAEKLTSHPVGQTVNPGDNVSYTIKITNKNAEPVVVEVESLLAENTTLFSGGTAEGNMLKWKLAIGAGETQEIGYIVKISDSAAPGTVISEDVTTVNGIQVYAGDIHVAKSLTEEQQSALVTTALTKAGETGEMAEIINTVYQSALGVNPGFITDSALYESVLDLGFSSATLKEENPMLISGNRYLYGGRQIKMTKKSPLPAQMIRENMLIAGDIIVGKKNPEDTGYFVYLVLDTGNLMKMTENGAEIIGGDMTASVLDSLLGMHSFAVLRPSLAMK